MRPIDGDKLIEEANKDGAYGYVSVKEIADAPTIEPYGTWIPCSERLPKCNGRYLVWRPHYYGGDRGGANVCYFDGQNTWHDADGVDFTRTLNKGDVIAWMPLPEPYICSPPGKNGRVPGGHEAGKEKQSQAEH